MRGGGGPIRPYNELDILHFEIEQGIKYELEAHVWVFKYVEQLYLGMRAPIQHPLTLTSKVIVDLFLSK